MRDVSPSRAGPHALTFRVMRLTVPLPTRTNALPFTAINTPSDVFENAPEWEAEGAPCGIGSLTVLPSSFGSIYAYETFRSFVSVFNRAPDTIESVGVSIMMQTASQKRIPLYESLKPQSLKSHKTINNVVSITLAELGVHVLVCTASYRDNGQTRSLRQFFRFNVLPPLEPTVSVAPLYRRLDAVHIASPPITSANFMHYLVDLRLLNAIPMPLYAVKAVFEPKKPYCVRALKRDDEQRLQTLDYMLKHGRRAIIGAGDVTTFLFHVYRKLPTLVSPNLWDEAEVQVSQHESVSDGSVKQMGKITIYWRTAVGENAQMEQDVVLTDIQDKQPDIEVGLCAVPQDIHVHQPFVVRCAARNNTDVDKRLYLQIRRDLVGDIVPVGVSGVSLGELSPGRIVRCGITMIALVRGQHTLTGIRVVDIDSKVSYKAESPSITVL
ncbi:unnamed protein product [Agarophyton chilense]